MKFSRLLVVAFMFSTFAVSESFARCCGYNWGWGYRSSCYNRCNTCDTCNGYSYWY